MEYNPVAINEVLAYSFQRKDGRSPASRRPPLLHRAGQHADLARDRNDSAAGPGNRLNNASVLDLGGFHVDMTRTTNPWDGGCWDIVFTADDPMSRPDPIRGQLQPAGQLLRLIPLCRPRSTQCQRFRPRAASPTPLANAAEQAIR